MSNVNDNRSSGNLPDLTLQSILDSINQFNADLPFLTGLTNGERRSLPKANRVNRVFIEDTLLELKNNPNLAPNYLDVEKIKADFELFKKLDDIKSALEIFHSRIKDTRMLSGSEAYSSCLIAYNAILLADKSGVPGAQASYKKLKARFEQRSRNSDTTPPTENNDPMEE